MLSVLLQDLCPSPVPDVTDNDGDTPLDWAVLRGKTEVADYLKSVVSTPEPGMCH